MPGMKRWVSLPLLLFSLHFFPLSLSLTGPSDYIAQTSETLVNDGNKPFGSRRCIILLCKACTLLSVSYNLVHFTFSQCE